VAYRPSIAERIAWTSGQLQSAEAKVLVALWSCGDFETGRNCRPYISTLVARSGLSRATVTRTLARLRNTKRPGGPWIVGSHRHRRATTYDLCTERLATAPPKEQQMSIRAVLEPPGLEAHFEPQKDLEAHFEPQDPDLEAQNEPPTSDPDLDLQRTTTTRAREGDQNVEAQHEPQADADLPLIGRPSLPRCAHPHAHAWCEGRVHVPRDLHFEFLDDLLGTLPGESRIAKAGRLIAFYAATMAALPATVSVGAGEAYRFWKSAFNAWVRAEAARVVVVDREPVITRYDAVWQQILERLETKVNRHTFCTWFRPLVMVTDTGEVIEVTKPGVDGGLFMAWIQKHYDEVLQAAVAEVRSGARVEVIDAWAMESEAAERDRKSG
jgi:DnaA N-terminal domain